MTRYSFLLLSTCAALAGSVPAQEAEATPRPDGAKSQKLAWPRDRERVICRVDGTEHTLLDLLEHIQERHEPRMLALMDLPTGEAYLQHPRMASWVRQYADVVALESEPKRRSARRSGRASRSIWKATSNDARAAGARSS
jgi:hypothetical protein